MSVYLDPACLASDLFGIGPSNFAVRPPPITQFMVKLSRIRKVIPTANATNTTDRAQQYGVVTSDPPRGPPLGWQVNLAP